MKEDSLCKMYKIPQTKAFADYNSPKKTSLAKIGKPTRVSVVSLANKNYSTHAMNLKSRHLLSSHGKWCVEPLLKCGHRLEDGGQEEVEQSPQLWQTVLQSHRDMTTNIINHAKL